MPLQVVISDSSCLIDLRTTSLLDAFVRLPYELLIPNTLFEDELLKFTAAQKKALVRGGLKIVDIPGTSVLRARQMVCETGAGHQMGLGRSAPVSAGRRIRSEIDA